jgi:hypothetical protein
MPAPGIGFWPTLRGLGIEPPLEPHESVRSGSSMAMTVHPVEAVRRDLLPAEAEDYPDASPAFGRPSGWRIGTGNGLRLSVSM